MTEPIAGIGIDLVKISRIRKAVERWDQRFLDRIFTRREKDYCLARPNPHIHLSGRFAVKEAFFKALGDARKGVVRWNDVEVLNRSQGEPYIQASGAIVKLLTQAAITGIHVSISHDTEYTVGQVILSRSFS